MKNKNAKTTYDKNDTDIIDLEKEDLLEEASPENSGNENPDADNPADDFEDDFEDDSEEESVPGTGIRRFLNLHVALVAVAVVVILICVSRLSNWGVQVDLDEIFKDGPGTYNNTFDEMLPLIDVNSQIVEQDSLDTILLLGNAPFADDRDSADSLASMIEEQTGATVYNCAVQNSYLTCLSDDGNFTDYPYDIFNLYNLSVISCGFDYSEPFNTAKDVLMAEGGYPEEGDYVYETLSTLGPVDAIVIMYDATDYYMGNKMYGGYDENDVASFTGSLAASLELLRSFRPDSRIIVMSPTYAYAVDEEGNYVSSDQYTYGEEDVLSSYIIKQCETAHANSVSFIDHLYGTVTEDNAKDYLVDNVHLNVAGRALVAERLEYFLNYYIKDYNKD